jgi:hypothetical protein
MNTSFERKAQKEEWITPRHIIDALGPFDLDPCSSIVRPWPTADTHFTREDNGLMKPWAGMIWMNPPYGNQTQRWFRRMVEHGNGIALTFARTETKMFFESVWGKASANFFIKKRLIFLDTQGNPKLDKHGRPQGAGAPSVLIAYGPEAYARLVKAKLQGWFISQLKT